MLAIVPTLFGPIFIVCRVLSTTYSFFIDMRLSRLCKIEIYLEFYMYSIILIRQQVCIVNMKTNTYLNKRKVIGALSSFKLKNTRLAN